MSTGVTSLLPGHTETGRSLMPPTKQRRSRVDRSNLDSGLKEVS